MEDKKCVFIVSFILLCEHTHFLDDSWFEKVNILNHHS